MNTHLGYITDPVLQIKEVLAKSEGSKSVKSAWEIFLIKAII